MADRMRRIYGKAMDPGISLDSGGLEGGDQERARRTGELVARLAAQRFAGGRYALKDEIARGGMGAILKVWDQDLRRHLAMKVIVGKEQPGAESAPPYDEAALARFLEEAQITGQLDHPGVVPVHELGLDSAGRLYFTMRLVKGRNLREIFDLVRAGAEGWTMTRALGVLLKVCEAMAYAHAKGVIHRDLKPSNVMVGRFGEVYVMDWGLARVLGRPDPRDLRLRDASAADLSAVVTDRRREREETPSSPVMTMDGAVLGTPSYMPPEQAMGRIEELGPRADVYSVGAMLYHLLAGQPPYLPPGARTPPYAVLNMLLHGAPRPIRELYREAPDDLVAICEQAMARAPERRYANTLEIARDIEAFLDRRPVSAQSRSLVYALRLWVQRNRAVAAISAAAVLVVFGLVTAFILRLQREVAHTTRLADLRATQLVPLGEAEFYPWDGQAAARIERWLEQADGLLAKEARYRREAEQAGAASAAGEQAALLLAQFAPLRALRAKAEQCLDGARRLPVVSLDEPRAAWERAAAEIAAAPGYGGLQLAPQLGLVPLGWNPRSGLYEFWHVQSGARPAPPGADGEYRLAAETGIVLVLLPGGPCRMGTYYEQDGQTFKEPGSEAHERRVDLELGPFFLSKYETTQQQWLAAMGTRDAEYALGGVYRGESIGPTHPIENVTWLEASECARRLGLVLPTEAQWEYACRATGVETPWTWGMEGQFDWLRCDNLDGQGEGKAGAGIDTYSLHAPVGSLRANGFGLFDMHGNVTEWCRDPYVDTRPLALPGVGDGLVSAGDGKARVTRGGCFGNPPKRARSGYRMSADARSFSPYRGLRLARALE